MKNRAFIIALCLLLACCGKVDEAPTTDEPSDITVQDSSSQESVTETISVEDSSKISEAEEEAYYPQAERLLALQV